MSKAARKAAGRGLQIVRDPEPFEIHVGALAAHHVGLTIALRYGRNVLTGPLNHVPAASTTKPLLVLDVGKFSVALHPTVPVTVIPDGCQLTITLKPKCEPSEELPQRTSTRVDSSPRSAAAVGDAVNGNRSMKLLPGRWRNRRKCHCGCGGKQSHGGYADGIAMTGGCEWSMRYWVTHGQLPVHCEQVVHHQADLDPDPT